MNDLNLRISGGIGEKVKKPMAPITMVTWNTEHPGWYVFLLKVSNFYNLFIYLFYWLRIKQSYKKYFFFFTKIKTYSFQHWLITSDWQLNTLCTMKTRNWHIICSKYIFQRAYGTAKYVNIFNYITMIINCTCSSYEHI